MSFKLDQQTVALASNPEEAAQIFKAAMTRALAEAAADAIKSALGAKPFATDPALVGWESFVSGAHIEVYWDKPAIAKSLMSQISSFVPFQSAGQADPAILGGSLEVGISIKGTF